MTLNFTPRPSQQNIIRHNSVRLGIATVSGTGKTHILSTLATTYKAKGLEWDRVYLMSVNNYDFPSNMPNDRFVSEKWFVRSGLDLAAESLAQLSALESSSEYDWYEEGAATMRSRLDYVKERLRLLYVGITRAKKDVEFRQAGRCDAIPADE